MKYRTSKRSRGRRNPTDDGDMQVFDRISRHYSYTIKNRVLSAAVLGVLSSSLYLRMHSFAKAFPMV